MSRPNAKPISGKTKGGDRLFVALELPERIRTRLFNLQSLMPGLKWTPAANLHLTLRFIGQVSPDKTELIQESLNNVTGDSFILTVVGLGMFQRKTGDILWVGVPSEPALEQLKQKVDESLRVSSGLSMDAPKYSPHITLSRLKNTATASLKEAVKEKAGERFGEIPVTGFTLFRSILSPSGAVHEPVKRYKLNAELLKPSPD